MKRLIIAEKYSLAKNIANALYCAKHIGEKANGYFEKDNEYVVTWCYGHLLELKDVEEYEGLKGIKWKEIALPFMPPKFELKIKSGKTQEEAEGIIKQVEIIKELITRNDVDEIIHCGDADREGQIIVDELLEYLGNTKKVTRLWLPEQTDETIRSQIKNCLPNDNDEYKKLAAEGFARQYMDWVLGINLTVFLTVKVDHYLSVGRIMIPIVKYIYDREQDIKNFKVEKYFQLESRTEKNGIRIPLILKNNRFDLKEKAEELSIQLNKEKAKVVSIERKEVKNYPKKLFSLSKLQEELSKKHKMNFETSMEIVQKLYEEGYVTYPRTNTEYLAETEKEKVKDLINIINEKGYSLEFKDSKKIFDTSKVESHSALTPTTKLPTTLSKQEETVYQVIFNRFISNFLIEETILSETVLTIKVAENEFKLKGTEVVSPGFYQYEPKNFDNQLPDLTENEEFDVNFLAIEKETEPPKKVTEAELSNHLEHPFKKEIKSLNSDEEENTEVDDTEDYKNILEGIEIGTVATRTPTIEKVKALGYISQENSNYSITSVGEKLILLLDSLEINLYKERTVEFSKDLKKVYYNMLTVDQLLLDTWGAIEEIVSKDIKTNISFSEVIGKCPKCSSEVIEKPKTFSCSNESCKFTLWKSTKHFKDSFQINTNEAKKLLNNEVVEFTLTTEEKKKKKAKLKIKINGDYVNFEEERESIGKCPLCGKEIAESDKKFYCLGYKEGCNFTLWKNTKTGYKEKEIKFEISKANAKKLLKKDGSAKFKVTDINGNTQEKELKIKIKDIYVNFEEVKK